MKSRVFSSKLWKNNIVGGVWLPVLLGIGFFFAFPVAALMQMGNWTARGYLPEQLLFLSRNLLTDGLVETGGFIIILAAFLNAVLGYFYLFSRDQVDFYHSLPVNRTHMFLQKLYMGLVYTMIPYLITVLLTLIVFIIRGYFEVSFLALALEMLFWHFLTYLFLYFCFVLIFSMTGTILMGLLSIFGFMDLH
ncbi:MAG: hypothetical protein Q4D29_11370 [Lachnospiraceae bacterium]|nr:hypothetical protein [Lachnospiraceae bacterium]